MWLSSLAVLVHGPRQLPAGRSRGVSSLWAGGNGGGVSHVCLCTILILAAVFLSHTVGPTSCFYCPSLLPREGGRKGGRRSRGNLLISHCCTVQYTDTVSCPFLRGWMVEWIICFISSLIKVFIAWKIKRNCEKSLAFVAKVKEPLVFWANLAAHFSEVFAMSCQCVWI